MWALVVGILVSAALVFVLRHKRQTPAPDPELESPQVPCVTMDDIPAVLEALSSEGTDGDFAVFLFGENGQPPASTYALNVQFSLEDGSVGIDWVLIAPLNGEHQTRFIEFFEGTGASVRRLGMNDVQYLRVETNGLAALLQQFLATAFGVREDQELQLIASGFEWNGE